MSNAGGRPPWIPPEAEKVESLAARGLTLEQIAECLGIHVATLYEKKKEYTEFADAIKRGQAKGISIVANSLYESAKHGNTTAQIFFLKSRAQWKETSITEANVTVRQEDAIKDLG